MSDPSPPSPSHPHSHHTDPPLPLPLPPSPPFTTHPHLPPAYQLSAFTALAGFINRSTSSSSIPHFELLPKGTGTGHVISPCGSFIGMEKSWLVAAGLWGMRWRPRASGGRSWRKWSREEVDVLRDVTSVLMVYDLDLRWVGGLRRGVMMWEEEQERGESEGEVQPSRRWGKERELRFLEGLMTSVGVERMAKVEGGWRGREWIVRNLKGGEGEGGRKEWEVEGGGCAWWDKEIGVVRRAGDVHGRNYYAWNYARQITRLVLEYHWSLHLREADKSTESSTTDGFMEIYKHMLSTQLTHALRHISDTSVLSFLGWVLLWEPPASYPPPSLPPSSPPPPTTWGGGERGLIILDAVTQLVNFLVKFVGVGDDSGDGASGTYGVGGGGGAIGRGGRKAEALWGVVRGVLGARGVFGEVEGEWWGVVREVGGVVEGGGGEGREVVRRAYRWVLREREGWQ
ncbi:hypothetical protein DFH27DRAFT_618116 [Peziza echinospora]|nr:hypothetical protein DFH27DRAFT_618116 [Peziza echinospora]